jgi:hypothetical protein
MRKKPRSIPYNPAKYYRNVGWISWPDWLGTRAPSPGHWRPFKKARAFVRRLHLQSGVEWQKYCKSGNKPADIPTDPRQVYANKGWLSAGDWLGSGRIADQLHEYLPFKKARAFARRLHLKSKVEWHDYWIHKKPDNIPSGPNRHYKNSGWISWGDWLGTGRHIGSWRSFRKARAFVRRQKLNSQAEWSDYCKSGRKPPDIPANPYDVYANKGWVGLGDWLGTGTVATNSRQYRSFKSARAFVRHLGLNSYLEWRDYSKSESKPDDIPAAAHKIYARKGWAGYGDWLGTGAVAPRLRRYRPFKKARASRLAWIR